MTAEKERNVNESGTDSDEPPYMTIDAMMPPELLPPGAPSRKIGTLRITDLTNERHLKAHEKKLDKKIEWSSTTAVLGRKDINDEISEISKADKDKLVKKKTTYK